MSCNNFKIETYFSKKTGALTLYPAGARNSFNLHEFDDKQCEALLCFLSGNSKGGVEMEWKLESGWSARKEA